MLLLLLAIPIGFIATVIRARIGQRSLIPPNLRFIGLVFVAVIVQMLALRFGTDAVAAAGLLISQTILVIFVWFNRSQSGILLLGVGLVLNLLVISANGGLMPISPRIAARLSPHANFELYSRMGDSKDVILPVAETIFWSLSDRFFLAVSQNYRVAYSIGDVFIAIGAFWILWKMSQSGRMLELTKQDHHVHSSDLTK